jgi:glycosyltransferase involved in cell wall biosynthesis
MKIGIDVSQAIFGTGVSDYTIDLVHALQTADPTNSYSLFGSSLRRGGDIQKLFPKARIFRLPPMLLHYMWNYLHVVNIENFIGPVDVFHSSDWTQPPVSCPTVTTVHDLSPFLFPQEMQSGVFRNITGVHAARMNWVVKDCAKIICVSQSTAYEMQNIFKVPSSRLAVIPEALPTRFSFHPNAKDISKVKNLYHLTDYSLAIGTPQPRKNISRLVKAYLNFSAKYRLPEKLVIVGGHGWGVTDIPDDPRIVLTGYLPDLALSSLLAGAKVLAFPSLHEGFGLPILMAFYHQVPVVTSNISSMPEVAGNAAILVDPKDEESIAHGLEKAVKNRVNLVKAGNLRLKDFSWDQTARKTLLVYSELV